MFYIYLIQNKIDYKIYVGQTKNPKIRWNQHKLKSRSNSRQYIHRAINFHGFENFTFQVIEEWESEKDINEAEEFWIEFFQTRNSDIGYNLTNGGYGSRGLKHSKESLLKMSKSHSLHYNDPTARQKQSEAAEKHYQENPYTLEKISVSLKNYFKDNPDALKVNSDAQKKYYLDNPDAGKKNSFSKKRKYSAEVIIEVRNLHDNGWTNIDIAKKFDMPSSYVSGIICGKKRKYE